MLCRVKPTQSVLGYPGYDDIRPELYPIVKYNVWVGGTGLRQPRQQKYRSAGTERRYNHISKRCLEQQHAMPSCAVCTRSSEVAVKRDQDEHVRRRPHVLN